MNYKKVLKNTLLLAPVALLSLQMPAWGADVTKTATCQKAPPAVDEEGVPLPPVVGKEGARPASPKGSSGQGGAAANCQPAAIEN
ncbi:hypothetical protein ACRFV7_000319 [Klebsiella oxytoca]|uniref:hypothetical protein n=1 Tax=Klebsiella oxytoca TaxID=571 RepID=UPI00066B3B15|nr:hypothetical protein [Klebsiella oxytoca]EJA2381967.1 hypothetical protein [Klebsiella oxytoca]EJZ8299178.1 hypothetical protein [Klebsiella oxytoca]EKM0801269.1 hypothetical protein [Klebsiella oxytoca]EKT7899646.1 hypothetical protein [Klebsiella oxytoca]ELI3677332.1 hypothetical protein [Klebsiella oxytoca]